MKKQVSSLVALLLALTTSIAQVQISCTATAASYLERGNAWYAKGELEKALGDYDLAVLRQNSFTFSFMNLGNGM